MLADTATWHSGNLNVNNNTILLQVITIMQLWGAYTPGINK